MPYLLKGKAYLRLRFHCLLQLAIALLCLAPGVAAAKPAPLVLCYQPMASPGGALAAMLQRDRILRQELERSGFSLQMAPVRNGSEAIALLTSGGAHISTLGDMPLLKGASEMPLYAFALIKQNYASVVGPKGLLPSDLKGKRIGNAYGTSSHFALMKTLASSGLTESDAALVPMEVTEMEDALLKGKIDAYAAWAPTPELTLSRYPDRFAAIGKQKSLAFLVISRPLADRHPELPRLVAAALVRAMNLLSKERKELECAADCNLRDIKAMKGAQNQQMTRARLAQDLRADLSSIGYSPRMPRGVEAEGSSLAEEFIFLRKLGKIPAAVTWSAVKGIFRFDILDRVSKNPKRYQTSRFDYDRK